MEQVLWLSALGAVLAMDYAMVGQFMVAQPLVAGGLFGALLGDPASGLFLGALIQLIWSGVIPVGAYIPSDHNITGGVAVILAHGLQHNGHAPLPVAAILALILAIPAGALAGQLDVAIRRVINEPLAQQVEAATAAGRVPGLAGLQALALVPAFLRGFLIYAVWLGPVAGLAAWLLARMPAGAAQGLSLAFWALPAVAFASLFELSARDRIHGWAIGAFAAVWAALAVWPGRVWPLFGLAATAGVVALVWRRKP